MHDFEARRGAGDRPAFAQAADAERTRDAWERFVHADGLHRDLLREHVHRAWQRSDRLGASAHVRVARELAPSALEAVLRRESDLLDASGPYLEALSRAAGSENHAAMLGDERGTVLQVLGDAEHVEAPGFPRAGSLLDEQTSGANGVGTPLAEGGYVELVGPEHFIEGFHSYTCQGLPIHAPDRRVVGVLSMSVRRIEAAERVREILIAAGHGVEAELMRRRLDDDTRRLLRAGAAAAEPFERLRQDVAQLQAAARLKLDRAAMKARNASPADAVRLALAAEGLVERFRAQSELWLRLASDEVGPAQRIDLQSSVTDLVELLKTEAAVRTRSLAVTPRGSVEVRADPRALSRDLYRALLRALDASAPGSTVTVTVRVVGGRAGVELSSALDAGIDLELVSGAS